MPETDPAVSPIASMSRTIAPPPALEGAIVAELRRERLIAARRGPRLAVAAAVAAALVVVFFAGQRSARGVEATHILLLFDTPATLANANAAKEYGAWARTNGHVVGGEELGASATIGPSAVGREPLGGYFLIAAASDADAEQVARDCPHIRHGGTIVVRKIVR